MKRVIVLFEDNDIKIVGEKPSETVKKNSATHLQHDFRPTKNKEKGEKLGIAVAEEYIKAGGTSFSDTDSDDSHMLMQRLLLLSFVVTVALEEHCDDDALAGIAQKSFLDPVKERAPELYAYSSDTGAFSFYYLAYRRGGDIVRRVGQTFAMLCSHDGDPIYQELGETIFCWFNAIVAQKVDEFNLQAGNSQS